VPTERFNMLSDAAREIHPETKWYSNFLRAVDHFDHRFFRKSRKELGWANPQHLIALQLAYKAVQQSPYYNAPDFDKTLEYT
jgi:acyl transferase domain-containing protein